MAPSKQSPAPPSRAPLKENGRRMAGEIAPAICVGGGFGSDLYGRGSDLYGGFVTPSQAVQERDLQVAMASPLTPPQSPELDPHFLAQRGLGILAEGRRNKDALKDFNDAIALDPQLSIAYYGRGSYYISQERYEDALAELDEAIALNPLDAMAWFSRGEVHRMQKYYPEALRDMDEAIRLDSSHETAFRGRAEVHCAQGHYAEAISDLQEALEIEPSLHELVEHRIEDIELQIKDEQVKNLIESGVAYMQQGQDEDALADFTEATRIDPECAEAFSSLGTITHKLGRLDEALSYHERAREIEPKYGGAYFGRAQVFHSQGKYQEALTDYQTALRIRPDMQWQIEPYMQDVQEKFIEKAAAAEADLLAELEEEEKKESSKKSKNKKKKEKAKANAKAKKAKQEEQEAAAAAAAAAAAEEAAAERKRRAAAAAASATASRGTEPEPEPEPSAKKLSKGQKKKQRKKQAAKKSAEEAAAAAASTKAASGADLGSAGAGAAPVNGPAEEALRLKLERQFAAAEAAFGGDSLLGGLSLSGGLVGSGGLLSGESLLAGLDGDGEDDEDGCFLTEEEILSASAAAQAKAAGSSVSAAANFGSGVVSESSPGGDATQGHIWERCSCGADNWQAEEEATRISTGGGITRDGVGAAGTEPAWCISCGQPLVPVASRRSSPPPGNGRTRRASP